MKHLSNQNGISLLEMIIFISLLSTIFLAIVAASTLTIKKTIFNQRKILATRYAEEAVEWMRGEKESNWTTFASHASGIYCMNIDITSCDSDSSCWNNNLACVGDDYTLDSVYKRTVILTSNGSRVDARTTVEWRDGPNIFSVPLVTTFSLWE